MDDIWSKIAKIIITIVIIVAGFGIYKSIKNREPEPAQRTFQDQIAEDNAKHRADPKPTVVVEQQGQSEQEVVEPVKIKFTELTEAQDIHAEKIFEMALTQFKTGRLPGMSFKMCIDSCRQISELYPGSKWDYKARRLMADVPKRHWKKYHVTEDEVIVE